MSTSTQDTPQSCPVMDCLGMAEKAAKTELGTNATNKNVSAKVDMTVAVTENGSTTTNAVTAGVTLGVSQTETPAPSAPASGK